MQQEIPAGSTNAWGSLGTVRLLYYTLLVGTVHSGTELEYDSPLLCPFTDTPRVVNRTPERIRKPEESNVLLCATAVGVTTYRWMRVDPNSIHNDLFVAESERVNSYHVNQTYCLRFENASRNDSGRYKLILLHNVAGSTDLSFTLKIEGKSVSSHMT